MWLRKKCRNQSLKKKELPLRRQLTLRVPEYVVKRYWMTITFANVTRPSLMCDETSLIL